MGSISVTDRWPHPPPKGTKCDASVPPPTDAPPRTHPTLYSCQKPAVETLRPTKSVVSEYWLCAEHVQAYVKLGYGYRNPRKFKQ